MPNIPNTTTANQTLTSVGDGTNASKWTTSSGSGGLPTASYNGQIAWWNASTSSWVTSASYVPPSSNSYLRWNGTTWEPDNGVLSGDITGTFSTTLLSAINGVSTDISNSPAVGDVIQYSTALGWYNGPISLPSGNGYSWNQTSGSAGPQTITTTLSQINTTSGEIEITVSGYTQYQVTVTGGQEAAASATSLIEVAVGIVPYSGITGGSAIPACIASTVSGAYSNFAVTFTITLPTKGSYTIAPYIQNNNSVTTNPKYAYFTFSVLGVF